MMDSNTANNDFEYARQIYHDLLAKGSESMEEMMEVARATEHPRAFEVLSNMMKNIADINGNLMDMHKKKKDFEQNEQKALPQGQTTNNVFVGSTSDLQRMLQNEMIDVTPKD
jgi:ABC-type proline/glycine betaine transport system substrate-binding protein